MANIFNTATEALQSIATSQNTEVDVWKQRFKNIFDTENQSESTQKKVVKEILDELDIPLNILIIGGTGVGKSSTINAIYGENRVKIGTNPNPQTQEIEQCKISKNITLYDSPGLGETRDKDTAHKRKIDAPLSETDSNGFAKIDLVLVIVNATVKGLGEEYQMIDYLIKRLGDTKRILIALNKCDCVVSERYFDRANNKLSKEQEEYLAKQVADLRKRIKESTGLELAENDIVCYSAGFYDENTQKQDEPYNIMKLEESIISKLPKQKRLVQQVEESAYITNHNREGSFWGNVVEFVETAVDILPLPATIKTIAKAGIKALKSFLFS